MTTPAWTGPFTVIMVALAVSGCSTVSALTTGSLTGEAKPAAAAAPVDSNTPSARALQVGTTAARATKCGYNFNAAELKSQYLAAEAASGMGVAEISKLDRIYESGFAGVAKAVTKPDVYCTAAKTTTIKADLQRHMAGDYTPTKKKVVKADDGFFSGWGDSVPDKGPQFGSESWWESQVENAGNK
ncbi:MAG: hypothetical protein AAFO75_04040 [Pseudomonadota bacterium]